MYSYKRPKRRFRGYRFLKKNDNLELQFQGLIRIYKQADFKYFIHHSPFIIHHSPFKKMLQLSLI